MTASILVTGTRPVELDDLIREAAGDADLRFAQTVDERMLADAEVVAGRLSGAQVLSAPRLRWVHSWAAGVDGDLSPELAASGAVLTSSAGNGAVPLAEQAMLLMLMLDRDAPRWMRSQQEHRWDRYEHGELAGRTLGIIGLGNSGSDLARKARSFHMRVVGVRRDAHLPVDGVDRIVPPEKLIELLPECDFVVVTAPLTDSTRGLFGAEQFAAMKRTAFWICVSRGGIADDEALLDALRSDRIAGAGLDAHGIEPLPADSPFWDLPNVIVTPHNGATTAATTARGVALFAENLRRHRSGLPLVNVVDVNSGEPAPRREPHTPLSRI